MSNIHDITSGNPRPTNNTRPLFEAGAVVATRGAMESIADTLRDAGAPDPDSLLMSLAVTGLIHRHVIGDQGELDDEDHETNRHAIEHGGQRIFSAFKVRDVKFWLITEADRSMTTILLPEEY